MGCGGSKNIKYTHNSKIRTINVKQAKTLDRWSLGAYARIKVIKMKRDLMSEITSKYNYTLFRNQCFCRFEKTMSQGWQIVRGQRPQVMHGASE
jgi:hypothetical protein